MSPRELLEFITRHTAHKSTKYISGVAGTDAGNLHSCLAGKRALPFPMAQRVAAVVGLDAFLASGQLALRTVPYTVINLEVDGSELQSLTAALRGLASRKQCTWRLVRPAEEVANSGVFAIAIASADECYFVISLTWQDSKEAYAMLDKLQETLPGVWLPQEPEQFTYSSASAEWLRLRAGIESLRTLEAMFMRESTPTIEDWAQMLIELNQMGAKPGVVARFMQGMVLKAERA